MRISDWSSDVCSSDLGDYLPPRGPEVAAALEADPAITHVVLVHCETSSGILNPVAEIAAVVAARGRKLLIDSMSAFGALPLAVEAIPYTAMVSSANKCIEGVPGFRSEERRVGKECVSPCRSRGSPY